MDGIQLSVAIGSSIGAAIGGAGGAAVLLGFFFRSVRDDITEIKESVREQNHQSAKQWTELARIQTRCEERHPHA